jgi:hypothetical protein
VGLAARKSSFGGNSLVDKSVDYAAAGNMVFKG